MILKTVSQLDPAGFSPKATSRNKPQDPGKAKHSGKEHRKDVGDNT